MNLRHTSIFVLASLSCFALGCGNKGGSGTGTGAGADTSKPAGVVDPKIAAMAKAASACKSYDSSFDSSCPDFKTFNDAKDDFNDGKADASLVAMLADSSDKIRYLGAYKLAQYGKTFKSDKGLAAAVVTAAENEKTKFASYELGEIAGKILVRETGLFDRVKAMVLKHEVPDMRRGILGNLLYNNQDNDAVFNLTRDEVKDSDKQVAMAALSAFWTGGSRHEKETCQIYFDNLDNANDDLAAEATNALPWSGHCAANYDGLLDSLDKRVKTNRVAGSSSFATSLRHVCEDAKASDAQKKKSLVLGRAIADRKENRGWIRASALETVMKCDPKDGRSYVGKFKADPDSAVKDKVKDLLSKK